MTHTNGSGGGVVHQTLWSGRPVTCAVCLQGGVPYWDGDDACWRMPIHAMHLTVGEETSCPGSMAMVTAAPTPQNMSDRIEQTFVDAMPSGEGTVAPDVPPASRLDPEKGLFA